MTAYLPKSVLGQAAKDRRTAQAVRLEAAVRRHQIPNSEPASSGAAHPAPLTPAQARGLKSLVNSPVRLTVAPGWRRPRWSPPRDTGGHLPGHCTLATLAHLGLVRLGEPSRCRPKEQGRRYVLVTADGLARVLGAQLDLVASLPPDPATDPTPATATPAEAAP